MKTRLTVVVDEKGEIVATHAPSQRPKGETIAVQSGLGTLPGQVLHEIDFDVPDSFQNESDVVEFHRRVQSHIAQTHKAK